MFGSAMIHNDIMGAITVDQWGHVLLLFYCKGAKSIFTGMLIAQDMSDGPNILLLAPTVTSERSSSGDIRKHIYQSGGQLSLGSGTENPFWNVELKVQNLILISTMSHLICIQLKAHIHTFPLSIGLRTVFQ